MLTGLTLPRVAESFSAWQNQRAGTGSEPGFWDRYRTAASGRWQQLNSQGFQVEEFGRNFYRIEAVPTWLSPDQAESFIRDLVDLVRQRGGMRKPSALDSEAIARLAVEGSYRRSDTLTAAAVEQLAKDLLACDTPHTSPFGKPTFNEVSWNEWERRFGSD